MRCWPEGPGLAHTAKKDTQTKAGARTAAKSSTWQGPRLLQEARSSLEAAPHGVSDARYHRALYGRTHSKPEAQFHPHSGGFLSALPFRTQVCQQRRYPGDRPFLLQARLPNGCIGLSTSGSHGESHSGGEATLGITLQVLPLGRQVSLRHPTPAIGDLYHLPASLSGTCGDLPLLTFSVLSHTSPVVGETLYGDHQKETPLFPSTG